MLPQEITDFRKSRRVAAEPYWPAVSQDPERPNPTIASGVTELNYGR